MIESVTITYAVLASMLLPGLSCLICYSLPARYTRAASVLAVSLLFLTVANAAYLFSQGWNSSHYFDLWTWFTLGQSEVSFRIVLTHFTVLMLVLISSISFLVHLFSLAYMFKEERVRHYFGMLGFFTMAMNGVVLADNLLVLFLFWELIGFASYRLICFYHEKPAAVKAATKAFVMTRIGDAGMLVGILLIWITNESLNLSAIGFPFAISGLQTTIGLLFFCGIVGKSAQFPLFTWLPDAMEGPTPVSALIHAATMVAAGIYLLNRATMLFTDEALIIIAGTGAITAILGGILALFQTDIKKLLAYSTISQLGLMVMISGAGLFPTVMNHLFVHGIFKAGLFLSAGALMYIIHHAQHQKDASFDAQNIRNLGGLAKKLPFISVVILLCGCSLAGLPLFSGFASKDLMLGSLNSTFFFSLNLIISIITVFYSFRLLWFTLAGQPGMAASLSVFKQIPLVMSVPLVLLAAGSLWWITAINPFETKSWIVDGFMENPEGFNIPYSVTLISATTIVLSFVCAWLYFRKRQPVVSSFTEEISVLYQKTFVRPVIRLSVLTTWIDHHIIDGFIHSILYLTVTIAHIIGWTDRYIIDGAVNFSASAARTVGSITRSAGQGKIQSYILWALLLTIILIASMIFV